MKKSILLTIILISSLYIFASDINKLENSDWYSEVMSNIEQSEYHIKQDEASGIYQSPNRQQNIRIYYYENGFSIVPRTGENDWTVDMRLISYGNSKQTKYIGGIIETENNTAQVKSDNITVEYINNKEGMRQNFIIKERPLGKGFLELHIKVNKEIEYRVDNDKIVYTKNNATIMEYRDLKVYDNNGKELKGNFRETEQGFAIMVNDINAEYPITIDPLSTTPDWMGECNQSTALYGTGAGAAGDVNGDGYSDVIVGAYFYDNVEVDEGAAFLYYGSSSGLSTSYDWMGESNQADAYYGISVGATGDVNGDGYGDVIVGAIYYDNGESNEGAAFVYYGSALGLSTSYDWMGEANQADAYYGYSVGAAGDVNGDGYSDVIIGAYFYDNVEVDEGVALVYYGSVSGLSTSYDWMGESDQASARYGVSVGAAGDVNGDGYSDVIVGANLYDNGESDEGAAFVYYGSISGLSTSYDWMCESDQEIARYGMSVGAAGDVNGDGYSDVIVGAYFYDNGESNEGAAFIYYGSASGLSTSYDWMGESDQATAYYGRSVGGAGDVNGDGYSDVIVGAHGYDNGESNEGAVFVYYGNNGGISVKLQQIRSDESAIIVAPLYSNYESRFKISMIGRNFIGRDKMKLQWEAKPMGTPFDGTGLSESASWFDTGINGIERIEQISGLSNNTYYKWRVRIIYSMTKGMAYRFSKWYYIDDNAPTEADLKTGNSLLINEINISSMIIEEGILLSVMGQGDRYTVDKKESDQYITLGGMINNTYTDKEPNKGMNEYRINEYKSEKVTNRVEIAVFYMQEQLTNMEGFYTSINKLNKDIIQQGLSIYDINGRKLNKIERQGAYYIIRELENRILTKEKVIIIY